MMLKNKNIVIGAFITHIAAYFNSG